MYIFYIPLGVLKEVLLHILPGFHMFLEGIPTDVLVYIFGRFCSLPVMFSFIAVLCNRLDLQYFLVCSGYAQDQVFGFEI